MASNDVCEMRLVMAAAPTARRETASGFRDGPPSPAMPLSPADGSRDWAVRTLKIGPQPGSRLPVMAAIRARPWPGFFGHRDTGIHRDHGSFCRSLRLGWRREGQLGSGAGLA